MTAVPGADLTLGRPLVLRNAVLDHAYTHTEWDVGSAQQKGGAQASLGSAGPRGGPPARRRAVLVPDG